MKFDFDTCFEKLMEIEGGFVNDARDSGGATKYGITISTLSNYRKMPCTISDVQNLTESEARIIYFDWYWNPHSLNDFKNSPIAYLIFDQNVNRGLKPSIMGLQRALGVTKIDGILGSQTRSTLLGVNTTREMFELCTEYIHQCQDSYCRIVVADPKNIAFIGGWINRTQELQTIVNEWMWENI